jgi:hypothetical protein
VWAAANQANYDWLVTFGLALSKEYSRRFGKRHKSQDVIEWCAGYTLNHAGHKPTPSPKCMPDIYKSEDLVDSYRTYYTSKLNAWPRTWVKYTNSSTPQWLKLETITSE